jgi:hypothetical protein
VALSASENMVAATSGHDVLHCLTTLPQTLSQEETLQKVEECIKSLQFDPFEGDVSIGSTPFVKRP